MLIDYLFPHSLLKDKEGKKVFKKERKRRREGGRDGTNEKGREEREKESPKNRAVPWFFSVMEQQWPPGYLGRMSVLLLTLSNSLLSTFYLWKLSEGWNNNQSVHFPEAMVHVLTENLNLLLVLFIHTVPLTSFMPCVLGWVLIYLHLDTQSQNSVSKIRQS